MSVKTAIREANQIGTLQPTTLVSYEADIMPIFDAAGAEFCQGGNWRGFEHGAMGLEPFSARETAADRRRGAVATAGYKEMGRAISATYPGSRIDGGLRRIAIAADSPPDQKRATPKSLNKVDFGQKASVPAKLCRAASR